MGASNDNSTSIKTIDRLVRILNCFSPEQPAWTLTKLSTHLDLPKGTLHRFLASMESHGILRRDDGDKQWHLGYRLFIWGNLAEESTALRRIARPILRDLVAATGEMALLTVYQDQEIVCIGKVDTNYAVRLALDVGMRRPPHAGASSKVLMAYLSEEEIQAIIRDKGLPKLCVNTITDPDELLTALEAIRERGYAVSHEETDPGAWGVATPVSDWKGNVIAAVGVAGPGSRFSEELVQRCVTCCRQAARRISSSLSGEGRGPSRN
jgi:DNA-binding IclR family transcriptional regulator